MLVTSSLTNRSPETSVLIVEDEAIIAMDLSETLSELGYAVSGVVDNAEDAIAQARSLEPDIILMDIVLRGNLDGIWAAQTIVEDLQIPVVYCSAFGDAQTVGRASVTGANAFVTKPYQPNQIRAQIETTMRQAHLTRQLRESEAWFATTLRSVGDAVIAIDTDGKLVFLNRMAEDLLHLSLDAVRGCAIDDVIRLESPGEDPQPLASISGILKQREHAPIEFGSSICSRSGQRVIIEDSLSPIVDEHGVTKGAVLVFKDVGERVRLRADLAYSERLFHGAFQHAAAGIAVVDLDGRIERANGAMHRFFGLTSPLLQGRTYSDLIHPVSRRQESNLRNRLLNDDSPSRSLELRFVRDDGMTTWGLACTTLLLDDKNCPQAFVLHVLDITRQKEIEHKLEHLANFDSLTGLVNRRGLRLELEKAVKAAERNECLFGVLFIDIDHFKKVNDTLGHDAGDRLLAEIGNRLGPVARETDIVARMGGDEFVVLVNQIEGTSALVSVAERIQSALAQPLLLEHHELHLSVSIGISVFPENSRDAVDLLRFADSALYEAKSSGRDGYAFYRAELTERTSDRMRRENNLRRALERGELTLHYQPILDLADDSGICFEALMRWHQDDQLIMPDEFIDLAEESGLIVQLGTWALGEACRQAMQWQNDGLGRVSVAVNISTRQMRDPDFAAVVRRTLAETGLESDLLCIEITESQFFKVSISELAVLEELRGIGVDVAVDDFGIGYSSLSYLKRFEPQQLKIDRSFIDDVTHDPSDAAIVSATIAMAHKLGIRVVAEGVENAGQLDFLRGEGCDMAQGFFLARPMKATDVATFLQDRSDRKARS